MEPSLYYNIQDSWICRTDETAAHVEGRPAKLRPDVQYHTAQLAYNYLRWNTGSQ